MAVIEIKNVTYTYPTSSHPSLKDINLSLEEGCFYAVIGKNGSGKSSLCALIRGFIPQFYHGKLEGNILFRGKDLNKYTIGELAPKIGYVFQNPFNQITGVKTTVFDELAYGLENFGVDPDEIRKRVKNVMELTDIVHLKDKHPLKLSGGQQQKVALASMIALDPEVYVIDEPTSQLDPHATEQVFEIISMLKEQKKTLILVEHKADLITEYADEVILLNDGQVIKQGNVDDVLSDMRLHEYGCLLPQTGIISAKLKEKNISVGSSIKYHEVLKNLRGIV